MKMTCINHFVSRINHVVTLCEVLLYPTRIQSQTTIDNDRIIPDDEDFLDEFDVVSLDSNGEGHIYNELPDVVVPPDDHMNFDVELANNAYDFTQDEYTCYAIQTAGV
eukprot:scaffold163799_cov43-Attheya_sp.AAC.1